MDPTDGAGKRDPLVSVGPDPRMRGQPDDYIRAYSGRIYPKSATDKLGVPAGDPLELASTHLEMVLGEADKRKLLSELAEQDAGMLDLVIGMLFNFDP